MAGQSSGYAPPSDPFEGSRWLEAKMAEWEREGVPPEEQMRRVAAWEEAQAPQPIVRIRARCTPPPARRRPQPRPRARREHRPGATRRTSSSSRTSSADPGDGGDDPPEPPLPADAQVEAQRILDGAARRLLAERTKQR